MDRDKDRLTGARRHRQKQADTDRQTDMRRHTQTHEYTCQVTDIHAKNRHAELQTHRQKKKGKKKMSKFHCCFD